MKILYYITIFTTGLMMLFSSCSDYLDSEYLFKDRMSTEDVFKSKDYSENWLAHGYSFLGTSVMADISSKKHNPFCFADDMYFGDADDMYKNWKNGDYNEEYSFNSVGKTLWSTAYKGIRQVSIYLEYIDMNKEMTPEEILTRKAEAHFLRGLYYWKLLRLLGPIPLLPEKGLDYTESYEKLALPRNSYEECVSYIESELLKAAENLPLVQSTNDLNRPTRGASLALRARLLVYAASPLMNGGGDVASDYVSEIKDDKGRSLMPSINDNSKWAKAAAAAKDVMELDGGQRYQLWHTPFISKGSIDRPATITPPSDGNFSEKTWPDGWENIDPQLSYSDIFNGTVSGVNNTELIFTRGANQGDENIKIMVAQQLPRVATGWNNHGMTLKMCDAYYMADGTDVLGKDKEIGRGDGSNRVSGFVTDQDVNDGKYKPLTSGVSLQYADREPRFYSSVAYNGSMWHLMNESKDENKEKRAFYYRGAGNGYTNTSMWLRTGIGVRKWIHPSDTFEEQKYDKIVNKIETNIRYAEILLIYAEAINELQGSYTVQSWDNKTSYTLSRDISEMKKGIQPIRIRGGVKDYTATEYNDSDLFRVKLKRERQIEFMGEGHRYYDLRRWLDAPVEEATPVYGCNVLATNANEYQRNLFHNPVIVSSLPTTFSRKMWFWPLSHTDLKRNTRLTQNPGWTNPY